MDNKVIDFLYQMVKNWENTYVRVRQDGKWRSLPLTQVRDQRVVLRFVMERLQELRKEVGKGGGETDGYVTVEMIKEADLSDGL